MDYLYFSGLIGDYLSVVLASFFLFILLFSDKRYKIHSFIIFLSSILAYSALSGDTSQMARAVTLDEYIKDCEISVLWDGVTALILTMFLVFDKNAWKQALLLAFAVLCHSMIIYDLTIASSLMSNFFYSFYDELIILIGLLQIVASLNGYFNALRNVREFILRSRFYCYCFCKGLFPHKKGKGRA